MSKPAPLFRSLLVVVGLSIAMIPVPLSRADAPATPETVEFEGQQQEISAASKPCPPEVASWWEALRSAAQDIAAAIRHRNAVRTEVYLHHALRANLAPEDSKVEAAKTKYLNLLKEGRAKSYGPPVADAGPVLLLFARPEYTEEARRDNVQGIVRVRAEFLDDGSVGKMTIVSHLADGLDEQALAAVQQTVFVPAIKDGSFSTVPRLLEVSFSLGAPPPRKQTPSAPIPPPGGAREIAGLAAPVQVWPANGSVFHSTPPLTTTLQWKPVEGATSYSVEVDCFHCCEKEKWCTDVGRHFQVVRNLHETQYSFDFVGAQPGRWRVWASDGKGRSGASSPWWDFSYTR